MISILKVNYKKEDLVTLVNILSEGAFNNIECNDDCSKCEHKYVCRDILDALAWCVKELRDGNYR